MVTYSAAPLESASVALIEPFALKSLSDKDGVYLHHLFDALGFGRVLDARLRSLGNDDDDINSFFRNVIAETHSFRDNAGLYITDDILKTIESDSVIFKISVTDKEFSDNGEGKGGVIAFVIPTNDSHNAALITSGGISIPAFLNNVGVSVLPIDFAFHNAAETLYTITQVLFASEPEEVGTNWSEGENIAVTIYRSNGETVNKLYQLIITSDGERNICKEAYADSSGYIPITKWSDVEAGKHILSSFVFRSHKELADTLNSSKGKKISLAVIGADEVASTIDNSDRFQPVFLGEDDRLSRSDAYGIDMHPVHVEDLPVDNNDNQLVSPATAQESYPDNDIEELFLPIPAVSDVSDKPITNPDEIETAEDLVNFAEYEVTHSYEPTFSGMVNDTTAETSEPFELGAEYLINEIADTDNGGILNVPDENEVLAENEVTPLSEVTNFESQESHLEYLQWSEVITGAIETISEGIDQTENNEDFGDISWDQVALTIADSHNDSDSQNLPIKGFLDRK